MFGFVVIVVDVPQLWLEVQRWRWGHVEKSNLSLLSERKAQRSSGTKLTNVFVKLNKKDRQNTV